MGPTLDREECPLREDVAWALLELLDIFMSMPIQRVSLTK